MNGGKDSGAVGEYSKEKDLNLQYAKELFDMFSEGNKFEPMLTREDDVYLSLKARSQQAMDINAHVFISIHCNASVSSKPNDMQTYYYNAKKDKPLAEAIFQTTDKVDDMTSRWSRVIFGNFSVLRNLKDSNIPACLIEVAFISNEADEDKLNDEGFRVKFCKEVVNGLRAFVMLS